nr:turripeptide Ici9.2-like isoform X2 [Biomphalaria glabrata]
MKPLTFTVCVCLVVIAFTAVLTQAYCPSICPLIYYPVCASNDRTFDNECQMQAYSCRQHLSLTKKHDGPC